MNKRIGFIGIGNMGSSLVGGLLAKGFDAKHLFATDVDSKKLDTAKQLFGIQICDNNAALLESTDILVIAVKPQYMEHVAQEIAPLLKQQLILTIAAGISIARLRSWLGDDKAIVRCMPNTPALMGLGASGLYANELVTEQQKQDATDILESVGIVQWFNQESDIDSVTALSGSGPAYFFALMEAMIDAATGLGLSKSAATELTLQTAVGAAQMAKTQELEISELRRRVTSPGGTTEAALKQFEQDGLAKIVQRALTAAKRRAQELN